MENKDLLNISKYTIMKMEYQLYVDFSFQFYIFRKKSYTNLRDV